MTEDLDDLIRRVDPDRWLSSRFVADRARREDIIALYAFDHELARAPRVASNPLLGEIRLTWWREMLDEAFERRPVRHHPAAQALADAITRRDLPRAPLEALIDARYSELDSTPMDPGELEAWARGTGGTVARVATMLLDASAPAEAAEAAGALWTLRRRGAADPALEQTARTDVRRLSPAAFPAVAHAVLTDGRSELTRRLRVIWAVARGRI